MMNCKQATQLLSEAQERKLSLLEKSSLRMHTAMCSGCRNFGKQMEALRGFSQMFNEKLTGEPLNKREE